jgi:acetyl esterase/lipase
MPPILLLAGEAEAMVPPKHTINLQAPLRKAGKPVEVKFCPGARHLDTLFAINKTGRDKAIDCRTRNRFHVAPLEVARCRSRLGGVLLAE